jgi:hypothetical protein
MIICENKKSFNMNYNQHSFEMSRIFLLIIGIGIDSID